MNHYQQEAARTLPPNTEPRRALNLGALGLGGEAGEAIDLIKKHLFHDQPLDRDKLRKELGDVLWYVAAIATGASLTLEEVAEANVAKLRARYPEGFSPAASVERADEKPGPCTCSDGVPFVGDHLVDCPAAIGPGSVSRLPRGSRRSPLPDE